MHIVIERELGHLYLCKKINVLGNVFIQQFKLNRRLDGVLTTWSHISIQSSTERWFSVGIFRYKPGYKVHDLL